MSLQYRSQYLGVTLGKSLTYRRHIQSLRKNLTSPFALLRRLARPGWGAEATTLRTIYLALSIQPQTTALLSGAQCSHPPYWPCDQRHLANCDWMPASYTSGQLSYTRRRPTWWASSQRSHANSNMPRHGAWTSVPLSAHLATEW